jgi:ribonuclease HI
MKKELNKLRSDSYRLRALTNHPAHRLMRDASNRYGEEIISAKRQHWSSYLEDMDASGIWTANRYLKDPVGDGGNPRIPTMMTTDEEGRQIETNENQSKATLFAKTFFPPPPATTNIPQNYQYPAPLPDPPPITRCQIERQIRRLSPYKAYGPDEIPNIVLQRCLDLIIDYLYHIYRAIIKLSAYYNPWREFTTVVLRKPGKPNYQTPKAYRPIALLSTLAKVLTAIVAEDISRLVELNGLLPNTHFGGRPGRTTTDTVHYLVHRIKNAWQKNQVASILFLDVEGAFPNAVTERLIHNLRRRRIPAAYIMFIKQLLTGRRTRLKFDDFISESISILNGIGQGDPLSMILYILYNADLLDIPIDDTKEFSLGFVDDIALVAIGDDFEETTTRLEVMMTKEGGGLQWSREHNSNFEVSKSVVLHATRRTQADPESDNARMPLDRPPLKLQGQLIQEVEHFKYLGIQIDAQLRWNEQAQRTKANATKWLLQFRRLTRPTTGVNSKLMRQLYLAVALPKITYGLDVWYLPPAKRAGAIKNSGSVGTLKSLQKLQRIATLAINGALRSTPTDLLDAHAGVLPMELALSKTCHRAIIRLLTLPPTHPLHRFIRAAQRSSPKKHPSSIDMLLKLLKLKKAKLETISPTMTDPYSSPRFKTAIPKSRKQSIEEEKADGAEFKIFTDGSNHDGGVGAAAVMFQKGSSRPIAQLKAYLGSPKEHNSYEAEIVGGILGAWLIRSTPGTNFKTVSIFSDNQAFVESSRRPRAASGQYLIQNFADSINGARAKVKLNWISGHSNVAGNERADRLAKEAADGRASKTTDLPPILRNVLPINASAKNQYHVEKLRRKWKEAWHESPRRRRFELIDDTFPFNGFRKRQNKLSRAHSSLMIQVRSGHLPLNSYLHRIGKAETKRCQECNNEEGEDPPTETVTHFLYDCNAFLAQRTILLKRVGAANAALKDIMMRTKSMTALAQYIVSTGRFKTDRG